jgi:2-C-methyl-D-erythritol 4-phosphate cytidylyltransferase
MWTTFIIFEKTFGLKKYAIIVAGGIGKRFNADLPKQFMPVCGKPLIIRTLEAFMKPLPEIEFIVVIHPKMRKKCESILAEFPVSNYTLADGGPERFHSVKNGLAKITDENSMVAIHDAVRPFVSADVILTAFKDAEYYGNAVPVVNINESVRIRKGALNEPVDRVFLYKVQTPQCFKTALIKNAYRQNFDDKFTDDAIVLESTGERIHLIDGNVENIKITYPTDMIIAEAMLNKCNE